MLLSVLRYVCLEKLFCFTFSCCCSLIFMFYLFTQLCWVLAPRPGMEPGPAASRAESQPLDQKESPCLLFCFVLFFKITTLLKYYPYTLQFTHFLCTRQWFLVFSQSRSSHHHSPSERFPSPSKALPLLSAAPEPFLLALRTSCSTAGSLGAPSGTITVGRDAATEQQHRC